MDSIKEMSDKGLGCLIVCDAEQRFLGAFTGAAPARLLPSASAAASAGGSPAAVRCCCLPPPVAALPLPLEDPLKSRVALIV